MSVHLKKTNQRMKIIGYILEALAKVVDVLVLEWNNLQVIDKVDRKNRIPPEEKSVPYGGIEISYFYFLCVTKVHKSNVREKMKQYKNDLIF